jgi:O-succinylbenzoate synthase
MVTRLYEYNFPYRQGLILQIGDHFGEIAPLPKFSRETLDEARAEVLHWMRSGTPPTLPSVRWGIACAKTPLQSIRLPLCALNQPRPGFSTLKLKLGHLPLPEAIALVKQHYRNYTLRLDCNRAWTLAQALEFAAHFTPTDFAYLEEPVQTFDELIRFSEMTHFPLAVDEQIHSDLSLLPSLTTVVVKPTIVGHIPKIPSHLNLVLSSSHETGLGLLHIARSATNTLPIGLDTYRHDILTTPIDCSSGFFSWKLTHPPIDLSKLCAL